MILNLFILVLQLVQNIHTVNGENITAEKALSIVKCAKQGFLYSDFDQQCWEPLSQGNFQIFIEFALTLSTSS